MKSNGNGYGESIKLARLYEKTSKNGNVYLTGRLGGAKIAILKSREVADDGSAIWEIMLSQASDRPRQVERPQTEDEKFVDGQQWTPEQLAQIRDKSADGFTDDMIPF